MKKTLIMAAAVCASALMLTGCGGSGSTETTAAASAAETTAAETEAAAAEETEVSADETEAEESEAETEAAIDENKLFCLSTANPQYRIVMDKPEDIFADDGAGYEYEYGEGYTRIKSTAVDADGLSSYIFVEGEDRETPAEYVGGIHYLSEDEPKYEEVTLGDTLCYAMDSSDDKKTVLEYIVGYELEDGSPVSVSLRLRVEKADADKAAMAAEAEELIKHISVSEMAS